MSEKLTLAAAGNVLPAALATLRQLGYVVTLTNNGRLFKAENGLRTFVAEDALRLLGLVKMHEIRGAEWVPTEVDDYVALDAAHIEAAYQRADVWEESGAVHVLCISVFGDPVELGEEEARDFAARLDKAIVEAAGG
ncbi:hypothetical protein [Roseateles sp. P5_E7]